MDQQTFLNVPTKQEYRPTIGDLPATERPTHRLHHFGAAALSTTELIAILVGGRDQLLIGSQVLKEGGSLYEMNHMAAAELAAIDGLGPAGIARLKAAFELGRRAAADSTLDYAQIRSPADAANLVMPEMSILEQEEMWVLHLDTKNRVRFIDKLYKGCLNTTVVRIGELFRSAVRRNANAIIVAHCHPSGDPTPSPEDVVTTKALVEAGKLMDIEVMDHLVIGRNKFTSLKERGLGF
jgi:DNA repair protein RadC